VSRREGLRFQLVGQLIELVEVDARPEAERVWNGTRRRPPPRLCLLAKAGAQGAIHYALERQAELARPLLEQSRQIVVDGEGRAHAWQH